MNLAQICPNCGSQVSILNNLSRIGYCDKCYAWLGLSSYENDPIPSADLERDNWVCDSMGQLLTYEPILDNGYQLSNNLRKILSTNKMSQRSLARAIHYDHKGIGRLLSGSKPNLTDILNLSFVTGYSAKELIFDNIKPIRKDFKEVKHSNRETKKINVNNLKIALDKAIQFHEGLSLAKFCKINSVSNTTIRRRFPKESSILVANYKKYKKSQKIQKHNLIRITVISLHERGIYPGRKRLNNELGRNLIADDNDKKVWIETLKELGYINIK